MYTLINDDGKYLYKTYNEIFIFSDITNMFFDTEEQATNWLYYNSFRFKNENVTVVNYFKFKNEGVAVVNLEKENKNKNFYDYNGFNSINKTFKSDIAEYHGLIEGGIINNGN